jgi:hypothetical protein
MAKRGGRSKIICLDYEPVGAWSQYETIEDANGQRGRCSRIRATRQVPHNRLPDIRVASLEGQLHGADRETARSVLASSGRDEDLVDCALIIRERIGMIDTLIHAAVITQVLPLILEPGETVKKRPSLGAGSDPDRSYDIETTRRVAEFKLSSWKGHDSMRRRGLFADVVGLSLDTTGRRRQVCPWTPPAATAGLCGRRTPGQVSHLRPPQRRQDAVKGGAEASDPRGPDRPDDGFGVHEGSTG